jgi:hypothetical protein
MAGKRKEKIIRIIIKMIITITIKNNFLKIFYD